MLILTRRVGEALMIGNEVTVTVLAVKGNQVRLGIGAPKDVAVHREEGACSKRGRMRTRDDRGRDTVVMLLNAVNPSMRRTHAFEEKPEEGL